MTFWDKAAANAVFTLPLDVERLRRHVPPSGRILDLGCGYGRLLGLLQRSGFRDLAGVDASEAMVARARATVPGVPIRACEVPPAPHPDGSFDAVLLVAVLTCVPADEGQRALMEEVWRLLKPGGIAHLGDFLLHSDRRNLQRYREGVRRGHPYGTFELEGGAVLRHHRPDWIRELTAPFESLVLETFAATTMRGHPATAFRFLGRKPAPSDSV